MKWLKAIFGSNTQTPQNDAQNAERIAFFKSLLSPEDFTSVGLLDTHDPSVKLEDMQSAYMTYTEGSGASGGVEVDVFICDGDADEVWESVNEEVSGEPLPDIQGIDDGQAVMFKAPTTDGKSQYAGLNVEKGQLVFCISIPNSQDALTQLSALAALVIKRYEEMPFTPA